jgi:hypothetical protein
MRRFVSENSLSLFFFTILAATLLGQSFAGQHDYNSEQVEHGESPVNWATYVTSPDFWGAVMENWQSEFLQFALFILATVWLIQRGSNESKPPEDVGRESDQMQKIGGHASPESPAWARARGWRTAVYENSLLVVMTAIFFATWTAQSLANWRTFNLEQRDHGGQPISWGRYLLDPDFWEKTLQNWQSEFLAVGTMAVFTIYLRQRGSPESKPVGAPHDQTGTSG